MNSLSYTRLWLSLYGRRRTRSCSPVQFSWCTMAVCAVYLTITLTFYGWSLITFKLVHHPSRRLQNLWLGL